MTLTNMTKTTLALAGFIALMIGAAVLFAPVPFYALSGVTLPDDVNLVSDIRAFGGGLLGAGLFVTLSLFRRSLRLPSLIAAATVYAGFGLARLWGITVDGLPEATYLWVLAIELIVAAMCAILVFKSSGSAGP
ncbi:protein of unknown function [Pacificibacter marinus]|uniref:DUF4345 domain-containing protein n=2 Tax=Pacificibacter marinus TaxID=658057 RepID=A0A1Y5SJB9_9RHOB|nr:protein of unknown function [Pacificibacter marinus]SLN41486.1 hypothetical protein PAM7971_01918 [Pacificibacter marinus]